MYVCSQISFIVIDRHLRCVLADTRDVVLLYQIALAARDAQDQVVQRRAA